MNGNVFNVSWFSHFVWKNTKVKRQALSDIIYDDDQYLNEIVNIFE